MSDKDITINPAEVDAWILASLVRYPPLTTLNPDGTFTHTYTLPPLTIRAARGCPHDCGQPLDCECPYDIPILGVVPTLNKENSST